MDNEEKEKENIVALLNLEASYHNHKENVAWVAIVLYLTLCFSLSFGNIKAEGPLVLLLVCCFVSLTFAFGLFVLWQLENKRISGNRVERYIKLLASKKEIDSQEEEGISCRVLLPLLPFSVIVMFLAFLFTLSSFMWNL